jgi:NADPH:quinone reductase-like Zn-dependent oxidoreductase
MTSIQITRFGGPEVLRAVDSPSPPLTPDGVRIAVKAAGVSFADVQMRMGLYPEAPRPPFVPGYEVAGVVMEVGPRVGLFRPGDRVLAVPIFGGYTTEIVLPEAQVRATPAHLDDAEAAAIPVSFLTAWMALVDMARVRPGDRVLVPGAAGGVGMAAVQIAARAGGSVIGLVGSAAKREAVLSLGAREVFTYEEWTGRGGTGGSGPRGRRTRTAMAIREFDVIVDPRGGASLRDSLRRLAEGGRVVSCGVSDIVRGPRRSVIRTLATLLRTPILNPIGLGMRNQGVFGMNVLRLFDTESGMRIASRAMDAILEVFRQRGFRVIVGGKWPLARAGDAHAFLQSRMSVGKLVLV